MSGLVSWTNYCRNYLFIMSTSTYILWKYGVERQTKDKIRKAMHRIKRIVNIPKTNQRILKEAQNISQKAIVEDGKRK